jgi:hypothetical protein
LTVTPYLLSNTRECALGCRVRKREYANDTCERVRKWGHVADTSCITPPPPPLTHTHTHTHTHTRVGDTTKQGIVGPSVDPRQPDSQDTQHTVRMRMRGVTGAHEARGAPWGGLPQQA